MTAAAGSISPLDSPGRGWFPDTRCTLGCCAQHDACFSLNQCSFTSWIPGVGSDACKNCNAVAASCISRGCRGVEDPSTTDTCYDSRCDQFYDCPETTSGPNCDCTSPCSETPSNCGNGTCEVDESLENCFADCTEGAGVNQCCLATNNCPTETPYSCPGDCCCCGVPEVCGTGYVCVVVSSAAAPPVAD